MEASSPSTSTPLNPLAEPFKSTQAPSSSSSTTFSPSDLDLRIYRNLSTYPFHQDAEFQSGLAAILGHPETPASPAEAQQNADLVLQAQCFYFARRNNLPSAIDPVSYKSWLHHNNTQPSKAGLENDGDNNKSIPQSQPDATSFTARSQLEPQAPSFTPSSLQPSSQPHPTSSIPPSSPSPALPTDPPPPEPRYPTSFNHIVDLITRNEPIPGIETIPNIVLGTEQSAPNTVPKRRKPWEKDESAAQQRDDDPAPDGEGDRPKRSLNDMPYGGLLGPLEKIDGDITGKAWAEKVGAGYEGSRP